MIPALFLTMGGAGVAWAKGDVERGKRLARECFACHGQDGYSPSPINPKIGGQHERYLFLSLKEYRDGGRSHSLMRGSVLSKTDQDLEELYAALDTDLAHYIEHYGYPSKVELLEVPMSGRFTAEGFAPPGHWISADLGVTASLGGQASAVLGYSGRSGDASRGDHLVRAGLRIAF